MKWKTDTFMCCCVTRSHEKQNFLTSRSISHCSCWWFCFLVRFWSACYSKYKHSTTLRIDCDKHCCCLCFHRVHFSCRYQNNERWATSHLFLGTKALFRLQANQISFSNQTSKNRLFVLTFASDQIGSVCPDITNLSAWIAMVTT